MVDTSHVFASFLEGEIREGRLDPDRFREAFKRAGARQFVAQIYSKTKTSLDLHVYVTDANGIVVFDSRDGRAEGQDYSQWRDVYLTLRGKYGARSTKEDPNDPASSVLYVAAPIMHGQSIAGVLTEPTPACNGADGLAALDVILAAHHSSSDGGRAVAIPLDAAQRELEVRFP